MSRILYGHDRLVFEINVNKQRHPPLFAQSCTKHGNILIFASAFPFIKNIKPSKSLFIFNIFLNYNISAINTPQFIFLAVILQLKLNHLKTHYMREVFSGWTSTTVMRSIVDYFLSVIEYLAIKHFTPPPQHVAPTHKLCQVLWR